jgi:hypothetical protein
MKIHPSVQELLLGDTHRLAGNLISLLSCVVSRLKTVKQYVHPISYHFPQYISANTQEHVKELSTEPHTTKPPSKAGNKHLYFTV